MRAAVLVLAAFACAAFAQEPKRPSPLKPGPEFQSPDVRALQADDFANPGMLWVARGGELWRAPGSPCPPQKPPVGTSTVSTFGISVMPGIWNVSKLPSTIRPSFTVLAW